MRKQFFSSSAKKRIYRRSWPRWPGATWSTYSIASSAAEWPKAISAGSVSRCLGAGQKK